MTIQRTPVGGYVKEIDSDPSIVLLDSNLRTERLESGRRILLRNLVVDVDGLEIEIPEGFDTDFSSIPNIFAGLVRWSRVDVAGVVHDYLYRTAAVSRVRADKIWRLVAMAGIHGANSFQGWVGYIALLAFGWRAWNKIRKRTY